MRFYRSLPAALAIALLSPSFVAPPARAADTGPVKIAVITDMSGVYASLAGAGAVEATKMAVEDFGGKVLGRTIEVDAIDHRNNGPDAAIKAREAYDGGADLALDMTNSAVALRSVRSRRKSTSSRSLQAGRRRPSPARTATATCTTMRTTRMR